MKGFFVFLIWTLGVCCRLDAQVLYIEYSPLLIHSVYYFLYLRGQCFIRRD